MSLVTYETSKGPATFYICGTMLVGGDLAWRLEEEEVAAALEQEAAATFKRTRECLGHAAVRLVSLTDTDH